MIKRYIRHMLRRIRRTIIRIVNKVGTQGATRKDFTPTGLRVYAVGLPLCIGCAALDVWFREKPML